MELITRLISSDLSPRKLAVSLRIKYHFDVHNDGASNYKRIIRNKVKMIENAEENIDKEVKTKLDTNERGQKQKKNR